MIIAAKSRWIHKAPIERFVQRKRKHLLKAISMSPSPSLSPFFHTVWKSFPLDLILLMYSFLKSGSYKKHLTILQL